ncbi:MAG: hypothetical protein IKP22_10305 [Clostridia bacterium]|nr:hypothetical protein [Clostridia bacterium]
MARKNTELEQALGFYILSVVSSDDENQEKFLKTVLDAASSPLQIKRFAQAAKNILNNGIFPQEKYDILKKICQMPKVSEQLAASAPSSDVVAGLWLKWCSPMNGEGTSTPSTTAAENEKKAIEADLQKAKKKISRLEKENISIEMEAGKDKLIFIIASIVPSVNELSMFVPIMERAGIDSDALAGYVEALQTILDALIDAGATMIGSAGEEVEFDPARHTCLKHIAKGCPVMVMSSGFMVDQDVVVPAVVKELED